MDILFLCIVVFLFMLAVFDLSVGVSNDAVNFLNSAVGSKAASYKVILIVAAVGIFAGASMSNGMMDIARHGIFHPENFSFYDIMCIFVAVIVTDIILLDAFNSLGMPTSTTVSLVFELLGATFVVSLLKISGADPGFALGDLINTDKALSVIVGIFLSVAIAFVFGSVVQYLARLLFTFEYKKHMRWRAGLFGGVALTCIFYFLVIKGIRDLSFMTPDMKAWIDSHTTIMLVIGFVGFTLITQLLHWLRVNTLKIIVLAGTFALAMAFAGNDLVNFIGVPLTGFASFKDWLAAGAPEPTHFFMSSLNGPANTPVYFLIGSGLIMVVALATSKKARAVVNTSVNLARQGGSGEEMFGTSKLSRRLVRSFISISTWIVDHTPLSVRRYINRRFDTTRTEITDGAAFDLLRASVNLVLAAMLIALGTSLRLPLSTTYVTFMVAMGTSLADRAWGRESAVFRITGVISVIGGWFITAGVAFIGAGIIVLGLHFGGKVTMICVAGAAIVYIIWANFRRKKSKAERTDAQMLDAIMGTADRKEAWTMLQMYLADYYKQFIAYAEKTYTEVADGFMTDNARALGADDRAIRDERQLLKSGRRRQMMCLRSMEPQTAIGQNAWLHLFNNCCISINYNLKRINDVCREHVDNNFRLLPSHFINQYQPLLHEITDLMTACTAPDADINALRRHCTETKSTISNTYHDLISFLSKGDDRDMAAVYVYLNLLQESREMVSTLRKLIRAADKLGLYEYISSTQGQSELKPEPVAV